MDKTPQELYEERIRRVDDAVNLRVPDRVPLFLNAFFFPARLAGYTYREAMFDLDKLTTSAKKWLLDVQPDMYSITFNTLGSGPLLEMLDFKQLQWPGHGISFNSPFQFVEGEYMKPDEYDEFLDDLSDYTIRTHLPRVCGALEPLKSLPYIGDLHFTGILSSAAWFSRPEVARVMELLSRAGAEAQKLVDRSLGFEREMERTGYPQLYGAMGHTAFDYIGNYYRGTRGVMLDMYQRPEKLLAAIDKLQPLITRDLITRARKKGNPRVQLTLHKGADGFMSLEQFKTFYWPSLKKLMLSLIEADLVPFPFFEGQYESRLEAIQEIPAGKAVYRFAQTDLFKVKAMMGKRYCLRGNVQPSLLCTGTPQDVRDYCKKLIDIVGKDGGFIMDGAGSIPDEARVENVRAMVDFTREYGVYR